MILFIPSHTESRLRKRGDVLQGKARLNLKMNKYVESFVDEILHDRVSRNHPVIQIFPREEIHAILRKLRMRQLLFVYKPQGKQILFVFAAGLLDEFLHVFEILDSGSIVEDTDTLSFGESDRLMDDIQFLQV